MQAGQTPSSKIITYIVSDVNKSLAMEWLAQYISSEQFKVTFILLNKGESHLEQWLKSIGVPVVRVYYENKRDFLRAFWQVRKQLSSWKTDIVHAHFIDANLVGLSAALSLGIKRRIYTRHYSTLHHEYFPKGVVYDKLVNAMSTEIVAITKMVQDLALIKLERVAPEKIHLIYHGLDMQPFEQPDSEHVADLGEKYQAAGRYPVVGVIARYTEWKGIQYIIPAFAAIKKRHPNALLLLANAHGDYKEAITASLNEYLVPADYCEIPFENDLGSLYQLFDVYVHVPISNHCEAFGLTYVEALVAQIPSVFTLSGIAPEFIQHEVNALVVPFKDSAAIEASIERLLAEPVLRERLRKNGHRDATSRFGLERYIDKLKQLYLTA